MCEMVCTLDPEIVKVTGIVSGLLVAFEVTRILSVYWPGARPVVLKERVIVPGVTVLPFALAPAALTVTHGTPSSLMFCNTTGVVALPDVRLMIWPEIVELGAPDTFTDAGVAIRLAPVTSSV